MIALIRFIPLPSAPCREGHRGEERIAAVHLAPGEDQGEGHIAADHLARAGDQKAAHTVANYPGLGKAGKQKSAFISDAASRLLD